MRKIEYSVSIGLVGCSIDGVIEVEDDYTEDEVNDTVWEDACNRINVYWNEIE